MKVAYNRSEIESITENKFGEKIHVLSKDSAYHREFADFIRDNTNFLDSEMSLMEVGVNASAFDYDMHSGKHVRRFVYDADGNCHTRTDYLILTVSGGKNGPGDWCAYFEDIGFLFANLKRVGYKAYLIGIENDCADDVFYMQVGVK